jgi:predicted RNA-binding protein with EMAP domain
MVQGVENLTQLVGTIVGRQPHPELNDYDIVTVDVERAEPVEGKANLLSVHSGSRIEVATRRGLLGTAAEGARIHFRAKRTRDGVMSEPHPEPGNFRIE